MSRYVVHIKDWTKGFVAESHPEYIEILMCKNVDCAACRRKQLELQDVMIKNNFLSAIWKDTEHGIVLRISRKYGVIRNTWF